MKNVLFASQPVEPTEAVEAEATSEVPAEDSVPVSEKPRRKRKKELVPA